MNLLCYYLLICYLLRVSLSVYDNLGYIEVTRECEWEIYVNQAPFAAGSKRWIYYIVYGVFALLPASVFLVNDQ